MKLSHSAIQTYLSCSEKWRLHYQKKLRSIWLTSYLFFGSALDEAFSRVLLEKKKVLTDEEKEVMKFSAEDIFVDNLENVELNNKTILVKDHPYTKYSAVDFEESLFKGEDLTEFKVIAFKIKKKVKCTTEEYSIYRYTMLESLKRKGLMLLAEYKVFIEANVLEVISIQETVKLPDADGNEIIGFIDFRCIFKDEPGVIYTVDNKTTSQTFTQKMLDESAQLSIYSEYTGDKKVAYLAVEKKIRKRVPRLRIYLIKGTLPEATKIKTFAEVEHVLEGISKGVFKQNHSSCYDYGKPCQFYTLCHHGMKKDLISVEKKLDKTEKTD